MPKMSRQQADPAVVRIRNEGERLLGFLCPYGVRQLWRSSRPRRLFPAGYGLASLRLGKILRCNLLGWVTKVQVSDDRSKFLYFAAPDTIASTYIEATYGSSS